MPPRKYKGYSKQTKKGNSTKYRSNNQYKSKAYKSNFVTKFAGNQPFLPVLFKKMTYSETHKFTVGTSGLFSGIQRYKVNSLFDPDETGGGHQPAGFDILTQIYNRYKVNHVKITMKVMDPSQDGIAVGWMLTNPSNGSDSIGGGTIGDIKEKQQSGVVFVNNTGSQIRTKVISLPMHTIAGVTKLQFKADPDNYTGSAIGDPGNVCKIQFAAADINGGSSATVSVNIQLEFYTMWYQRKTLAQS